MITQLQQLGLNEKEAKVYLASLELGQSTVQEIAKKAGINRPTTYFVIDGLMKRGLMSSFHKGKKQYFVAADPDRLVDVLEKEKTDIEEKKKILQKMMPQLQSLNVAEKDRPVVRYYEGKEGLQAISQELIKKAKDEILTAYSVDDVREVFSDEERAKSRKRRIEKGLKIKVIYTFKNGIMENTADGERRKIPFEKFPLRCDLAIYGDYVRIASFGKRMVGIVIEDKEIAESFKSIFKLAWEGAEKYNK